MSWPGKTASHAKAWDGKTHREPGGRYIDEYTKGFDFKPSEDSPVGGSIVLP